MHSTFFLMTEADFHGIIVMHESVQISMRP